MILGNQELNHGLGLPQVVHGSGRPCIVFLLPPPPPPTPVAAAVSPPLEELRYADDAVAPAPAPPAKLRAEPPRKRGRLHGEDDIRHQHLVKELAVNLVRDTQFRSEYKYCRDESSLSFRSSLVRIMKRDLSLINVMKGRNRCRPELVQAALLALERLVSPRVCAESGPSLKAAEASPRLEAVKASRA